MKRKVPTRATLLLLLLVALPAMAQESGRDPAEPPSSAAEGSTDVDGAGSEAVQNGKATESPVDTAPAPGKSPFDYRPSEQISEDLSVSFPVDI